MSHALSKSVFTCLVATTVLLATRDAAAQTGYGGTIGTVAQTLSWKSDFTPYLQRYDGKNWIQMNATEQQFFFNRAKCECVADTTNLSGSFRVAIQNSQNTSDKIRQLLNTNSAGGSGTVRLFAGSNIVNCLNPNAALGGTALSSYCVNLLDPNNKDAGVEGGMATIAAGRVWYSTPISVAWLFNAINNPVCPVSGTSCDSTANCDAQSATVNIYFWAQTSSTLTPDMQDSFFAVNLVGRSAFVPVGVAAKGGDEALTVSWGWPNGLSPSGNQAFMGVQIFCVRGADTQVFENDAFGAAFKTAATTCPSVVPVTATGIGALDPSYLCSGLLPSTTSSHRITGLQNGINYGVGVAAVDKYGNASALTNLVYGMPVATVDFFTEYKQLGGDAQGGFCSVAKGARRPGWFAVGGLAVFGLLAWRRRKRGRPGAGPLALLLATSALAASPARAQAVYHDSDVIRDEAAEPWGGTPQQFAVEVRFGLYTPAIDSEFGGTNQVKPQSFIFGDQKRPMWQLEVDWQLFHAFGSLAIGGVIGYYKENARACLQSSLNNVTGNCERTDDNTGLRLIPFAALLVYRFDVLAEHWRIPLVPYGKVGLNYTIWTVTNGNGNVSTWTVRDANGNLQTERGQGGTAGWQAAVGLALRLDFLDPAAARGFDADAGVNHSYAFFELATIRSSGLGSKNALPVGDSTWFAGLMFEF